jgi:hypothetical protein
LVLFSFFSQGSVDLFKAVCLDLGDLKQIIIGHDNSGVGADWFLDKVYITNDGMFKKPETVEKF